MKREPQHRLLVIRGPSAGRSYPLAGASFTVGRSADNDLQLPETDVSRRHCVFHRRNDGFIVHDLDSRHGTFVNDVPVRERPLEAEDRLIIGSIELVFLVTDDPATTAPRPSAAPPAGGTLTVDLRPASARYLSPIEADDVSRDAVDDLEALFAISRVLQTARDARSLAAALLERLMPVLAADRGAVLLSGEDETLDVAAVRDREGTVSRFEPIPGVCEDVLAAGIARLADDAPDPGSTAIGAWLCVPMVRGDEALGVLYFDRAATGGWTDRHLELATAAGVNAALAFDNARHVEWLRSEHRRLQAQQLRGSLIGESPPMQSLFTLLEKVAPTDTTVLVRGESGTGKELVAKAIHRGSPRADGPFVAINCAALSESLLESELFGHERGAFTGALARQTGKLEVAHRGTLFLDEVGEIPSRLQARLLRVLQERTFERVGGHRTIQVDLRIVAATNRDLEAALRDGTFRDDLYYRLNVITVRTPPLRERSGDITLLVRYLAREQGRRLGRRVIGASPEALALLEAYDWPGNVRQLANAVERAVVLGDDELIRPEDLPDEVFEGGRIRAASGNVGHFQSALIAAKCSLVETAFVQADGDHRRAAAHLGLHPNSLHRLIRRLGIKERLER